MTPSLAPILLRNRHTDETLALRRVQRNGEVWLEMKGTLPPRREGPPRHIHFGEDEEFHVTAGTLSAEVDGRTIRARTGETALLPAGSVHRWWNDGDEPLAIDGYARPVNDLDLHLQAAFDVINSGSAERPPLFYMARVAWRHRRTQSIRIAPLWIQSIVFPAIVLIGTLLGRYRGTDWPGCPARYAPAPMVPEEALAR